MQNPKIRKQIGKKNQLFSKELKRRIEFELTIILLNVEDIFYKENRCGFIEIANVFKLWR